MRQLYIVDPFDYVIHFLVGFFIFFYFTQVHNFFFPAET